MIEKSIFYKFIHDINKNEMFMSEINLKRNTFLGCSFWYKTFGLSKYNVKTGVSDGTSTLRAMERTASRVGMVPTRGWNLNTCQDHLGGGGPPNKNSTEY